MNTGRACAPCHLAFAMIMLLAALTHPAAATDPDYRLAEGSGSFVYPFTVSGELRTITVWYHRPEGAQHDAPIVFVMHGRGRNGQSYRRAWIPHAEAGRYILLVPEFSRAQFGRISDYSFGNVMAADGSVRPEGEWSFAAVENIFDRVTQANALAASRYDIYGHSGGGQFVHRMVLAMPKARFRVAVAANAGSYAMPDPTIPYPYGIGGLGPETLQAAFRRQLIVLLGDRDTDPNDPTLPRAPQAMKQGPHRLARGERFFSNAREAATKLGVPFNWSLHIASGGHSNAQMTTSAARFVGYPLSANGSPPPR